MNREILFRGKRLDNGEWVEGGYWLNDTVTRQTPHIIDADGESHAVDPSTVGQYTGLTDKNGTKIFEGDIVSAGYYKWKCEVLWDVKCARFICFTFEGERRIVYVDMVDKNGISVIEVIGNIHDGKDGQND